MDDIIMLSVLIPTYNHEGYIENAVNSVLMQKVNFRYEVFIGEDCSTDHTREVLRKLESSLPDCFTVLYREKNTDKGVSNFADLYERAKGKYVIVLEGDDYWTYEYKLQKQVDFLEAHPDFSAVSHNVEVVNAEGKVRHDYVYPECKKDVYTFKDYRKEMLAGQTATMMRRNPNTTKGYKDCLFFCGYPGDRRINYVILCNGRVGCIQEKWSAYRFVPEGGSSYSATVKLDKAYYESKMVFFKRLVEYTRDNFKDNNEALYTIESMYLKSLLIEGVLKRNVDYSFKEWLEEYKQAGNKVRIFGHIFIYEVGCRVMRKLLRIFGWKESR